MRKKSFLLTTSSLTIATLVLSACTPNSYLSSNSIIDPSSVLKTPIDPTLDNIDQKVYSSQYHAKAAPNPNDCQETNRDVCYFQYLNDRSFSIFIKTKSEGNSLGGGFGTGWFVDREVGTNNFYIATNIHVANLGKTTTPYTDKNPDPQLLDISIGKQELDRQLLNKNTSQIVPSSYQSVGEWTSNNHADSNHRILTEVKYQPIFYGPEFTSPKNYNFSLIYQDQKIPYQYSLFLARNLPRFAENFRSLFKSMDSNSEVGKIFSFDNVFDFMLTQDLYRNNFSSSQRISKDQKLGITKTDLHKFFKTTEEKKSLEFDEDLRVMQGYNDMATLKVNIPNDYLAKHFPYFLDPNKYNEWTFPRFSQKNLWTINDDYDANPVFFYHAGYPVEQIKKNLTYRSKGGPTFRSTKSKLVSVNKVRANSTLELDNFTCDPAKNLLSGCDKDKVPRAGLDFLADDDYTTGGGSSGSLVIDKDYNAVGIYWGVYFNQTSLVTKFSQNSAFQPFYNQGNSDQEVELDATSTLPLEFDYTDPNNKDQGGIKNSPFNSALLFALKENFYNNFVHDLLNKRTTQSQKLLEEIKAKANDTDSSNKFESIKNDVKKIAADSKQNIDEILNLIAYYFVKLFLKRIGFKFSLESINTITTNNYYGNVDYKSQMTKYFKDHNIKTYHLNNPKKPN
ncbi:hypothetical protein MCAV_06970 [[Mycoplasma] cavipharyngis]|uniref:DUF31 family putative serine protease n=1 Tax=[Mycoplasma] cavipharyngis TaxID=92757 RepID=UPI0037043A52